MSDIKPKISLGLPVYNESEFLDETILSLINQTHENIEIIAIDNGSNDNSYEILEKYSRSDKRIKIFKNDENIGLSNNFNLTFRKSTGRYFVWIGA
ncbi:MAG: glycosyltransferase family 2 protein, partial [Dehalococcoidia bacterium]